MKLNCIMLIMAFSFFYFISCDYKKQKATIEKSPQVNFTANNSTLVTDSLFKDSKDSLYLYDANKSSWKFQNLYYQKVINVDSDPSLGGVSIEVAFSYPTKTSKGGNEQAIQKTLSGILTQNKYFNIKEGFDFIVKEYTDQAKSSGDEWIKDESDGVSIDSYYLGKDLYVGMISKNFLTVFAGESSYLGGAHGSFYKKVYNISMHNGEYLSEDKIFQKGYKLQLNKLIQDEIVRRNNSDDLDENISLLIDLKDVASNNNFFFDKKGIIFLYNQYEIAPYVQGLIEIHIPYTLIYPLFRNKYKTMIENFENKRVYIIDKQDEILYY